MNDSIFTSKNVLNYWTTMDITYEQIYRITATRSDWKTSRVMVTLPRELPTPLVTYNNFPPLGYNIYIDDSVENVACLQSK